MGKRPIEPHVRAQAIGLIPFGSQLVKNLEAAAGYYWVDAKVSADFFSFLCFKFLLKQNTINQQRIYHCYL